MKNADQKSIPFKVFGLQRTGTNLIQALMGENFNVRYLTELETGWKHGPPTPSCFVEQSEPTRFVLCVKNPYAWLTSCYRYFQRSYRRDQTMPRRFQLDPQMSFEEFVLSPSYDFPSPVHRWNLMYRCWLMTLPAQFTAVVRQEDQLLDQARTLSLIEQQLRLKRRHDTLRVTDRQIDVNTAVRGPMDPDPYLLRSYMGDFSLSLLRQVNRLLDRNLMDLFGYSKERSALSRRVINETTVLIRACTPDGWQINDVAQDRFGLKKIYDQGAVVRRAIVIEAQIGATVLQARQLWGDCKIEAYESDVENLRLLRLNTRSLAGVCVSHIKSPSERAENSFSEVSGADLLVLGTPFAVQAMLGTAAIKAASVVPWIAGKLGPADASADSAMASLQRTHAIDIATGISGRYFLAQRLAVSPSAPDLQNP
jgi:hypothetical protein